MSIGTQQSAAGYTLFVEPVPNYAVSNSPGRTTTATQTRLAAMQIGVTYQNKLAPLPYVPPADVRAGYLGK